ncbi:unnamed protein product, partial [Allacma fusca]
CLEIVYTLRISSSPFAKSAAIFLTSSGSLSWNRESTGTRFSCTEKLSKQTLLR